jgi:hypothetical protein
MSRRRRIALAAVSVVALGVGAIAWREVTRTHTVIVSVPDATGFFAVWCKADHPDVVQVRDRVARFDVPQDGLLLARSMACLEDWVHVRFEDADGRPVEDAQSLGTSLYSDINGDFTWFYRGSKSDVMYSSGAQRAWLSKRGVGR